MLLAFQRDGTKRRSAALIFCSTGFLRRRHLMAIATPTTIGIQSQLPVSTGM
jgi:hypothetical protein